MMPLLKRTCVTRVALDEWFPPNLRLDGGKRYALALLGNIKVD